MSGDEQLNPLRFLKSANRGRRFELPETMQELYKLLGADPRFAKADPKWVIENARLISKRTSNTQTIADTLHSMLNTDASTSKVTPVSDILKKIQEAPQTASAETTAFEGAHQADKIYVATHNETLAHNAKPTSTIQRMTAQWEGLAMQHKVGIGISYILAAMTALGAAKSFAHGVEKDENGNAHLNISNVTHGAISALLAAGIGYLGHAQFKAAIAR